MESKEAAKLVETVKRQRNTKTVRAAEILMMGHFDQSYPLRLMCECCDVACRELIEVKNGGFKALIRKNSIFYVKPGHENKSVEKVIQKEEKFYVVEKPGKPLEDSPSLEEVNVTLDQLKKAQPTKTFHDYYKSLVSKLV